jgi:ribosomal protein S18 acetylase RimI-like enzyme
MPDATALFFTNLWQIPIIRRLVDRYYVSFITYHRGAQTMSGHTNGIKPAKQLTRGEIDALKKLTALCDREDNIRLKMNWSMVEERNGKDTSDFLYLEHGEIIACLGIYSFRASEVEISGMVHPDHRRKGIFTKLVHAAIDECARRDVHDLIFMCQRGAESGAAFIKHLGAPYSFSEYWMDMKLEEGKLPAPVKAESEGLRLRKAGKADLKMLVRLDMDGFKLNEQEAEAYSAEVLTGKDRILIAELGQEPVGKLGVRSSSGRAFFYGFVVDARYRGKGIGRQMLARTIERLHDDEGVNRFQLEVAVDNEGALGLYKSCGFRLDNVNDYYLYKLS